MWKEIVFNQILLEILKLLLDSVSIVFIAHITHLTEMDRKRERERKRIENYY